MDNRTLGIITLLRCALKDEPGSLPKDFDWSEASSVLYEHHLVAMAVRGAARCGVPPTNPAVRGLTALFCKDVAKSRLQTKQLHAIYAVFQERGIAYMPVKGAVIKSLYPQSELRAMGDADILIRQEQYPIIRDIMLAFGMQSDVESDHEYVWHNGDFKLELHKYLIPSYNKDYFSYYGDGWRLAQKDEQSGAYFLGPEDHFIYLLVHFAKHYRDGSISAKNICDFWVYRNAFPNMDKAYISSELQKLKLLDFYRNILDLLDTWFEGATATEAVEILTKTIFQGGICVQEKAELTVSALKLKKENTSLLGSKWKLLWERLFPSARSMANRYPILQKAPVLLPFVWVVRCFEMIFCSERRKHSMAVSRELMQMDLEQISGYEKELRSVGLDFHLPE